MRAADPMWLVLCDEDDAAALWAYEGLRQRNILPIELVTSREIACDLRVTYRARSDTTAVALRGASERRMESASIRGGLNRLHGVYPAAVRRFVEEDRSYVCQESQAALLGWLSALTPNLINRPTSFGLAGRYRSAAEWIWLAGRSGLPTKIYREASSSDPVVTDKTVLEGGMSGATIFVLCGRPICASRLPSLADGCVRLARLAETLLLGVDFVQDEQGLWWFAGASPAPNIQLGGDALLDRLAVVLTDRR